MQSFDYHHGWLMAEGATQTLEPLIAAYSGPTMVYSRASLLRRVRAYREAFADFDIHYAMKANHNFELLKTLQKAQLKADVVSLGEVVIAKKAGFAPADMIFAGVGKTRADIEGALRLGVGQLNVESPQELMRIAEIAAQLKVVAPVAFRLNPDVNAKTHPYIATGYRENKFGMDSSFLPELVQVMRANSKSLRLVGLAFHIGSQLFDVDSWGQSLDRLIEVYQTLKIQGFDVERLDIGGGVGIHYTHADETEELEFLKRYGQLASSKLRGLGCRLQCEPGRFLVARSAALITQVQYIKTTQFKKFVIVDSGINHLIRPALYDAYHRIVPVKEPGARTGLELCDVVGPICESADFFAKGRPLPEIRQDDFLAVMDVGAYGSVMSSTYNCHAPVKEVFV